jgi:hypothetical protein
MKIADKKHPHIYISDLYFENKIWRNELSFFKDEILIFENRLGELIARNSKPDFLTEAESLQNRLIREREVIDTLRHDITVEEDSLARYAQEHPIAIDHVYFDDHSQLRAQMERFRTLYDTLKGDFTRFAAKWM